jgi:hypothetical protein
MATATKKTTSERRAPARRQPPARRRPAGVSKAKHEALEKRLASARAVATRARKNAKNAGMQVASRAAGVGVFGLASYLEGRLGPEKMKVGPVDVRAAVGFTAITYGLLQTLSGRSGDLAMNIGTGAVAAWVGPMAYAAGANARERAGFAPTRRDQAPPWRGHQHPTRAIGADTVITESAHTSEPAIRLPA